VTHGKNKDFRTEGETKFLFLVRKFALISFFSLLDKNQLTNEQFTTFWCLQISVKF